MFDLWFTLVSPDDHRPNGERTDSKVAEVLDLDEESFLEHWRSTVDERYMTARPLAGYLTDYLQTLGREPDEEQLARFDSTWRHHDEALTTPRPEIVDALTGLKAAGYTLGLLSNANEREVRAWDDSPLAGLIDQPAFSCQIGCMKPDPYAYHTVLRSLEVPAAEAIFVGDGASAELAGARAAGFAGVFMMRRFLLDQSVSEQTLDALALEADGTIDDLSELAGVLEAHASA